MAAPVEASVPAANAEEHVVIFRLADKFYALDVQAVREIVRVQSITRVPGADQSVEGITNLRGRVAPVIDLRRCCGLPKAEHGPESRIVVVNTADCMVGLIVDLVTEVLRTPGEQVELPSAIVGGQGNRYLRGIAKLNDRLVSLMDLDGLLLPQSLATNELASSEMRAA